MISALIRITPPYHLEPIGAYKLRLNCTFIRYFDYPKTERIALIYSDPISDTMRYWNIQQITGLLNTRTA